MYLSVIGYTIFAYILYKIFFQQKIEVNKWQPPKNHLFFGDDYTVFTQGLIGENKITDVGVTHIEEDVNLASYADALYETDAQVLTDIPYKAVLDPVPIS